MLGACKVLGKTENRQIWIDFPYPKEIFLALHFDRFCLEIKKKAIFASARAWFLFYNQENVYPSDFFTG